MPNRGDSFHLQSCNFLIGDATDQKFERIIFCVLSTGFSVKAENIRKMGGELKENSDSLMNTWKFS